MVEEQVRQLLHEAVPARLPESCIDVGTARRAGRRRLRWRRAAVSAGSLGVLSAVTAISLAAGTLSLPWGGAHGAPPAASRRPAVKHHPLRAPRQFTMLVPYAAFGYLPSGFSTDGQSQISAPTYLQLSAAAPSQGTGPGGLGPAVSLDVNAAGACRLRATAGRHLAGGSGCTFAPVLGRAPDVQGRPAYWVSFGVIWQYAPGAWASLTADLYFFHPQASLQRSASRAQMRKLQRTAMRWATTPPSGASAAELLKVAGHVRFAQATPIRFPFRLSGSTFARWQPAQEADFQTAGGLLLGNTVTAAPARHPGSGVSITVAPAHSGQPNPCAKVIPQQTQPVTVDGVPAVLRILNETGKQFESLCVTNIHGMSVFLGEDTLRSLTGFFVHIRLLGTDPAHWTTRPLG
jgi:hypothetical protein